MSFSIQNAVFTQVVNPIGVVIEMISKGITPVVLASNGKDKDQDLHFTQETAFVSMLAKHPEKEEFFSFGMYIMIAQSMGKRITLPMRGEQVVLSDDQSLKLIDICTADTHTQLSAVDAGMNAILWYLFEDCSMEEISSWCKGRDSSEWLLVETPHRVGLTSVEHIRRELKSRNFDKMCSENPGFGRSSVREVFGA
ncbi:MAG: hypothetical protein GY793_06735 [Proteobacteria bacterium]|nr:hypothetical protein [Pseudomonadota bacterium]